MLLRWRFGLPGSGAVRWPAFASAPRQPGYRNPPPGKQDRDLSSAIRWTTRRFSTKSCVLPQFVDKSPGYTRGRWRPNLSGPVRSRGSGGDAEQRLATALRPPERGRAGKDPRFLPDRMALRTRHLPALLE